MRGYQAGRSQSVPVLPGICGHRSLGDFTSQAGADLIDTTDYSNARRCSERVHASHNAPQEAAGEAVAVPCSHAAQLFPVIFMQLLSNQAFDAIAKPVD